MSNTSVAATVDERLARIRQIVVDELELDLAPEELDGQASFVDEYEADSLALIQIVSRMDRELGVKLPAAEIERLVNLDAIRAAVEAQG
ncbi:acyl carrier protein [Dactylosporangium sp. NPDC005572]|uniref:acyl carrier protein n=1 Tax=Dactylosporangium sp. NPDC005572 TaxID=3156889 RepID=UPI0033B9B6C5